MATVRDGAAGGTDSDPDEHPYEGLPIMLTEFGGIAYSKEKETWGYKRARTPDDFGRSTALLASVRSLPLLAGFCYTQFTDTYQEANGLLYMDRTAKFPIADRGGDARGGERWGEAD